MRFLQRRAKRAGRRQAPQRVCGPLPNLVPVLLPPVAMHQILIGPALLGAYAPAQRFHRVGAREVKTIVAEVEDAKESNVRLGGRREATGPKQAGSRLEQVVHLFDPAIVAKSAVLAVLGVVAGAELDVFVVGDVV